MVAPGLPKIYNTSGCAWQGTGPDGAIDLYEEANNVASLTLIRINECRNDRPQNQGQAKEIDMGDPNQRAATPSTPGTPADKTVSNAQAAGNVPLAAPQRGSENKKQSARTKAQIAKDIALFFAAPFITLAYLSLFPFIALALIARAGGQARHRGKVSN
jgi:hypothetical protein